MIAPSAEHYPGRRAPTKRGEGHIIATTYGFWLPNDERRSGSDFVRAPHLEPFGPANPVDHARSVAYRPFDREIRRLAREALMYPHVEFTGRQALAVARGFRTELETFGGAMHACAILPNHFHAVVPQHRYDIRRFCGRLKGAATKQLRADGLHPLAKYERPDGTMPSPWARLPWVVYLFTGEDMRRAIRYVEQNPVRARMPKQRWSFVTPYRAD
jgi:REP element-mobilizing transposase RayT